MIYDYFIYLNNFIISFMLVGNNDLVGSNDLVDE